MAKRGCCKRDSRRPGTTARVDGIDAKPYTFFAGSDQRGPPARGVDSWSWMERCSLGEHELHLRADLPVRTVVGSHHVVVGADLRVHRQLAEMEDVADAT